LIIVTTFVVMNFKSQAVREISCWIYSYESL